MEFDPSVLVRHDGTDTVTYGTGDSTYIPGILTSEEERAVYNAYCDEQCIDPATGQVLREMPVVNGVAQPDNSHTQFYPKNSRIVRNQWGEYEMPFRETCVGVWPTPTGNANPSVSETPALRPKHPWGPTVQMLRRRVEQHCGLPAGYIDHCNVNLYAADGKSKLGQHHDGDDGMPKDAIVRTVTLGGPRTYRVQKTSAKHPALPNATQIALQPGSLNILGQETNKYFTHGMVPTKKKNPRISFNFRSTKGPAS